MKREVKISDGTVVEIEPPGVGYEIEAYGAIPSLGLLATEKITKAELKMTPVELLMAQCFMVIHGAVKPRFSLEGGGGMRPVKRLLPPDLAKLAAAIVELRDEAMEEAKAEARPTVADASSFVASANARK